jgi:hypothetical protein
MRKMSSEVKSGNILAPAGSLSRGLKPDKGWQLPRPLYNPFGLAGLSP